MTWTEFTSRFPIQLNQQQESAVQSVEGPVLLLAVPGSGKTTVLVTRLGYMIFCKGIAPERILTVTYTVAATKDMAERFACRFGAQMAGRLEFRTINGICARVIQYCSWKSGRTAFSLLTDEKRIAAMLAGIYQRIEHSYPTESDLQNVRTLITFIKNRMLGEEEIRTLEKDAEIQLLRIYKAYNAELREHQLMDYDDQMVYAYTMLQRFPWLREHFQQQYPYICVDEAQDTSKIQHAIIALLASRTENLFMVGDEDQSIYGFRAAYPEALLRFSSVWPGAKTLLLEDNYRSTPEILHLAGAFIAGNRDRYPKTIRAAREPGCRVRLAHAASRQAQYRYLLALAQKRDAPFAVLYRNNDSALPLIDALERAGLPYRCRSFDDTFFTHRIVCDVQDILCFAAAPDDAERFLRIYYKFGAMISKEAAQAACAQSARTHASILDCLLAQAGLSDEGRERVRRLRAGFESLKTLPGEALMRTIWGTLGYGSFVAERRLDPGKYFILHMLAACEPSAEGFLARLTALRQTIRAHADAPGAPLTLSTIHSSKGLEYERVYLLDIHDGVLPSRPDAADGAEDERREYEEDRRLFYVAMTRAKDELTLFEYPDAPSAFIREARGYLPVPVREKDDFAAIVPENACGLRYRHGTRGEGSILAQCEDELLVAFPDGDSLMQAGQMLLERSRETRFRQPDTPAAAPAPDAQALCPGSVVRHKKYGPGRIVSLDGPFADIRFEGETAPRRFNLAQSLRSGFLFAAR